MKDGGFSLIEVLVATTIMAVALVGLAELSLVSSRRETSARTTTMSAVLASQKLEQLRSAAWGFDSTGLPVTDTTELGPSPAGTLASNTPGWVEYLDGTGASLGGASALPPPAAQYIRRWSVEPSPTHPDSMLVLQVLVTRQRDRGGADSAPGVGRLPDEARLVSAKTRRAP